MEVRGLTSTTNSRGLSVNAKTFPVVIGLEGVSVCVRVSYGAQLCVY